MTLAYYMKDHLGLMAYSFAPGYEISQSVIHSLDWALIISTQLKPWILKMFPLYQEIFYLLPGICFIYFHLPLNSSLSF